MSRDSMRLLQNGPTQRSNLFESHWSNQWLTSVIVMGKACCRWGTSTWASNEGAFCLFMMGAETMPRVTHAGSRAIADSTGGGQNAQLFRPTARSGSDRVTVSTAPPAAISPLLS